ncbi:unnamed protein product [Choristocarpus tenellus]
MSLKHQNVMGDGACSSGSSDWDEWADAMVEQTDPFGGTHGCEYGSDEVREACTTNKRDADVEWMEKMMAQGSQSMVQELDDVVWDRALEVVVGDSNVSSSCSLGPDTEPLREVQGPAATECVMRWLRRNLPRAAPILNAMRNGSKNPINDGSRVYVDSLAKPSAVIRVDFETDMPQVTMFSLSAVPGAALAAIVVGPGAAVIRSLANGDMGGRGLIMFKFTDVQIHEESLKSAMGRLGLHKDEQHRCGLWALPLGIKHLPPLPTLEKGVEIVSKLSVDDAELINSRWPHRFEGSEDLAKRLLTYHPSAGVRKDGQLVAWCLVYTEGTLAMLHTEPPFRKKGYAGAAVTEILRQMQDDSGLEPGGPVMDSGEGGKIGPLVHPQRSQELMCHPGTFAVILDDNKSSLSLFSRLGFQRVCDAHWLQFTTSPSSTSPSHQHG